MNHKIIATPVIAGISNENANPGDSVYVYGNYLKGIQKLTFAGTTITSFASSSNGSHVGFVLPTLTQRGPVSVTTQFGTATTVYHVNDVVTGSISNWDSNFNWQGWGAGKETKDNSNFHGNRSTYFVLDVDVNSEDGWPWTTNIPMNAIQWVPKANIADTVSHWAFKFEVNIPKTWKGTTVNIVSGVRRLCGPMGAMANKRYDHGTVQYKRVGNSNYSFNIVPCITS
ncbi:glycan-binding surface protein [Pedobacter panaciterrae]